MDSLTHGLLGLAIGVLRRPDRDRVAVLVACVLAAEIPDLDYLWPAENSVLHSLMAHRGFTHSLLAVPWSRSRRPRSRSSFFAGLRGLDIPLSLPAVLFAHLLADAWTGWGTRLALPFSDARVTLDWMMVVDPLFTLPLLVGALWGIRKRTLIRSALLWGAAVSCVYLAGRVAIRAELTSRVQETYPTAETVQVFPSWFGPSHWRYVAVFADRFAVGRVSTFAAPQEQANTSARAGRPPEPSRQVERDCARGARVGTLPHSRRAAASTLGRAASIADLRYHLNGAPTLLFRIDLDGRGRVVSATLDRGGSARSLVERFRGLK